MFKSFILKYLQISCELRGINVFDELELPKCGQQDESNIFNKITINSLAPPKCDHCLPPCNNMKYEFKVIREGPFTLWL